MIIQTIISINVNAFFIFRPFIIFYYLFLKVEFSRSEKNELIL